MHRHQFQIRTDGIIILIIILLMSLFVSVYGADRVHSAAFQQTASSLWSVPATWDGSVPVAGDDGPG